MAEAINPFRTWLGIDTDADQLNHYELLDLPAFEADADTIHRAADRAPAQVPQPSARPARSGLGPVVGHDRPSQKVSDRSGQEVRLRPGAAPANTERRGDPGPAGDTGGRNRGGESEPRSCSRPACSRTLRPPPFPRARNPVRSAAKRAAGRRKRSRKRKQSQWSPRPRPPGTTPRRLGALSQLSLPRRLGPNCPHSPQCPNRLHLRHRKRPTLTEPCRS